MTLRPLFFTIRSYLTRASSRSCYAHSHLKPSLTNSSSHIIARLLIASSLLLPVTASYAESNVIGEEITISGEEASKFSNKEPSSADALTNKKTPANSQGVNIDSSLRNLSDEATPVIVISSDDLWQRIKDGYAMPDSTSNLVANHEKWYSTRPDYIRRMVERSQKYLFHIVEEVEKRGMPTEIALLPMIESAYNPQAYSRSQASGIWQFIPSTGKHFGLQQNWWIDNRRNVIVATDAALTYLQKLHGMFGSWDLALAAYNAGEGTVGRAIERNRRLGLGTDYESLNLPPETRNYVPKLQAVKNIMTNPGKYGLKIQTIANTAYFTRVSAPAQIDAHLAAKLAEISDEEFLALNPSNNRPLIGNNDEKHELLLPILAAQTFRDNLANYNKPLVSWKTYLAKRGERMEKIAAKFGIQLSKLRNVNNLPNQNKIKNASTILVPNGNKTDFTPNSNPLKTADANSNAYPLDPSLTHSTDANLVEKNSLNNTDETEPSKANNVTHLVKKGETIFAIAKLYQVSIDDIVNANSLANQDIKIGQTLSINNAATPSTQTESAKLESNASEKKLPEKNKAKVKKSKANKSKLKKTKTSKSQHKKLKKSVAQTRKNN
ncbi:membrane-bound lytic murein transglycosylase D [Methylophilaceae bacterium]